MYTYLLLNIGTILFPLLLSFDKKVHFYTYWKALFPSIFVVAALFILWDIQFTELGVWAFNPDYLTGIYWANLPMEEWMFFFTIPYACIFIYECIKAYLPFSWNTESMRKLYFVTGSLLFIIACTQLGKLYTTITFFTLGVLLIGTAIYAPVYLGRFAQMYLIHLVPFFLINGVLTALPVVLYNNAENLGIRMGTVPFEDPFYSMLLLLLNVHLFEFFKKKFQLNAQLNSIY
ncbi:MAG: lycopene cyclase domain-containing protein [Bacteroidota bacterium]